MLGPAYERCCDVLRGSHAARRTGYHPDHAAVHFARPHVGELIRLIARTGGFGTSAGLPWSVQQYDGAIKDQGQNGTCMWQSAGKCARQTLLAAGWQFPATWSNADFAVHVPYAQASRVEQGTTGSFTDQGLMPASVIQVAGNVGLASLAQGAQCPTPDGRYDDTWGPSDGSAAPNITVDAQPADVEQQIVRVAPGAYNIDTTVNLWLPQVTALSTATKPIGVQVCTFVDSGVLNWQPANGPVTSINLNDPNGGGHGEKISYCYVDSKGRTIIGLLNSWGIYTTGTVPGSPYFQPGYWECELNCLLSSMSQSTAWAVTLQEAA